MSSVLFCIILPLTMTMFNVVRLLGGLSFEKFSLVFLSSASLDLNRLSASQKRQRTGQRQPSLIQTVLNLANRQNQLYHQLQLGLLPHLFLFTRHY